MERNPESYRWLILLGLHALFLLLLSQLNFTLAEYSIYIFINGIFILYPALYFPVGHGFATTFLFSLVFDAGEPWTFGTSLIPNIGAFLILVLLRKRIHHEKTRIIKPVLLMLNLGLFSYYMLLAGLRSGFSSTFLSLNLYHLLWSQIVLFLIASWIMAQQTDVLRLFGVPVQLALRLRK